MQNAIRRAPVSVVACVAATVVLSTAAPDPLSELKSAVSLLQAKQSSAAIAALRPLSAKLPKVGDYVAWFLASAQYDAQQFEEVPKTLSTVWSYSPVSPLVARSAILASRAYVQTGDARSGISLLRKYYEKLPQPQGDVAMAEALAGDNDLAGAAIYYQRVYYSYPLTAEAAQAEGELARLKTRLGDGYPPALGTAILSRAVKLLEAGQTGRARTEITAMIPLLNGAERETALVKLGVADYQQRQNAEAQRYLSALTLESPDADAERLYYLVLAARRANNRDGMADALVQIERKHPASQWRLQALTALGDVYLVDNKSEAYEPQYRVCYESFPKDSRASGCHWKVTMAHYLQRSADAADLLREHLLKYPGSDDSPAALYFLGRLAQEAGDQASARTYWAELIHEYPNHYHSAFVRQRMAAPTLDSTSQAAIFLRTVPFPTRVRTRNFVPNALANIRLERARLLHSADLDEWAETELRYAAQAEDQPHVMGLELASIASRRGSPEQAIRYLKRYASDYLFLPIESAPAEFWRLAFPLPYKADIEKQARQNGLDPYFLAALIRQESEFDPNATSVSNARGLTQIMPATGRELSRRLQIKPYSTARLFQPAINIQIGAFFLRSILDRLDGHQEAALAAYNAGPSRARTWLMWGDFRDPVEFVEAVPFQQTRNYIQVVLRNAEMYRRIYAVPAKTVETASASSSGSTAGEESASERRQAGRGASAR